MGRSKVRYVVGLKLVMPEKIKASDAVKSVGLRLDYMPRAKRGRRRPLRGKSSEIIRRQPLPEGISSVIGPSVGGCDSTPYGDTGQTLVPKRQNQSKVIVSSEVEVIVAAMGESRDTMMMEKIRAGHKRLELPSSGSGPALRLSY